MRILACTLLVAAAPALAQDIVVGQSAPLTGANAELGNDIRNGALAYFKKVNDAGGLPQGKLKLVTLDDVPQSDPRVVALRKKREEYERLLFEEVKKIQQGIVREGAIADETLRAIARAQVGR